MEAEGILIVPKSIMTKSLDEAVHEVHDSLETTVCEAEKHNESQAPEDQDISATQAVDNEGVRVASDMEEVENTLSTVKKTTKHRWHFGKDTNILETRALFAFIRAAGCRWQPWDVFFENTKKCEYCICYRTNLAYQINSATDPWSNDRV